MQESIAIIGLQILLFWILAHLSFKLKLYVDLQ